jgi:hypothetical protein
VETSFRSVGLFIVGGRVDGQLAAHGARSTPNSLGAGVDE